MESTEHKNEELLLKLKSKDQGVIAETLDELRDHGTTNVLPDVFRLMFTKGMEPVNDKIVEFLNDIKDQSAVPAFMDAVSQYRGKKGYEKLISACWQCGLDFSSHIDTFINLVLEDDYFTSLEAFSVVEENASLISSQQRSARVEIIRSRYEALSPEKRNLVNELMSVLSNFSGPFTLDPDILN